MFLQLYRNTEHRFFISLKKKTNKQLGYFDHAKCHVPYFYGPVVDASECFRSFEFSKILRVFSLNEYIKLAYLSDRLSRKRAIWLATQVPSI